MLITCHDNPRDASVVTARSFALLTESVNSGRYDEQAGSLYGIKRSFLFTTLRSHPRFRALLKKMNLDEGKTDES